MAIPNLPLNPVVPSGFANVVQYRRTIGDRLRLTPWHKLVSERIHIGIGAHTRIAKQVPSPTHGASAFQNCKGLGRASCLQVISSADSREPRAHDQGIEALDALRISREQRGALSGCRTIGHLQSLSSLIDRYQSPSESYISPRIASTPGECKNPLKSSTRLQ